MGGGSGGGGKAADVIKLTKQLQEAKVAAASLERQVSGGKQLLSVLEETAKGAQIAVKRAEVSCTCCNC